MFLTVHLETFRIVYNGGIFSQGNDIYTNSEVYSDELFQIIYTSLDFNKHNYSLYSKTPNQQIITIIGPEKIRGIMIETADKLLSQSISSFKYTRYISICLDGGKTGSRHFIDFVAWSKRSSFSIFIKDTQSFNARGYDDLDLECLNHDRIKAFRNKVVCFVADCLRAQLTGIDPESNDSFQHRLGAGDLSKIMFSPCYNHRIQNASKKTYRENNDLKRRVIKVNKLAIFYLSRYK